MLNKSCVVRFLRSRVPPPKIKFKTSDKIAEPSKIKDSAISDFLFDLWGDIKPHAMNKINLQ
jgi:hypothetical protein